jgi:hypothetical protein
MVMLALDDWNNREHECSGGIDRGALLGMANGVWGLLRAIPIIGLMNVGSQHIEERQSLTDLLRE